MGHSDDAACDALDRPSLLGVDGRAALQVSVDPLLEHLRVDQNGGQRVDQIVRDEREVLLARLFEHSPRTDITVRVDRENDSAGVVANRAPAEEEMTVR